MTEPFRTVSPGFFGMAMSENPNLLVPGPTETVKRTWRERLFTRPWRPLQATRLNVTWVPDTAFYVLEGRAIVAHPSTMAKLKETIAVINAGGKW